MKTAVTSFPLLALLVAAPAAAQSPFPEGAVKPSEPPAASPAPAASEPAASATASATPSGGSFAFGLAPRVGLTVPTSKLGAFFIGGLELDFFLPVADRRLVIALDGAWTRPSYDGGGMDPRAGGAYTYTIKESELKLGLDIIFRFLTDASGVVPYAGAGPIMNLLETRQTNSLGPGTNVEQGTKYGVELLGGLDFSAGPGRLLGEARFSYSSLDHLLTGATNAGNVAISVGYRLVF